MIFSRGIQIVYLSNNNSFHGSTLKPMSLLLWGRLDGGWHSRYVLPFRRAFFLSDACQCYRLLTVKY
jgi:hypothetical protein